MLEISAFFGPLFLLGGDFSVEIHVLVLEPVGSSSGAQFVCGLIEVYGGLQVRGRTKMYS